MGFSKNPFLDLYDDLERQQTSFRDPQQTLVRNFTPVEFMLVHGGGLLLALINTPHLKLMGRMSLCRHTSVMYVARRVCDCNGALETLLTTTMFNSSRSHSRVYMLHDDCYASLTDPRCFAAPHYRDRPFMTSR